MLRIYFMQHWFNLSDPGMEEAPYDSRVMREFAGIDLVEEAAPDETTILNFRHLLEEKGMGAELLRLVNMYLEENGLKMSRGTHRGCEHHQCAEFDEEPGSGARSGHASDEER